MRQLACASTLVALAAGCSAGQQLVSTVSAFRQQIVAGRALGGLEIPTISAQGIVAFDAGSGLCTLPFGSSEISLFPAERNYSNLPQVMVQSTRTPLITDDGLLGAGGRVQPVDASFDIQFGNPASPARLTGIGSPIPGQPGMTFGQFMPPNMNRSGRLVFSGGPISAIGGPSLFYSDMGGPIVPLLTLGQPAPGVPGAPPFTEFTGAPSINSSGAVALTAFTTLAGESPAAIFAGQPGAIVARAKMGDTVGSRVLTRAFRVRQNDAGTLAYLAPFADSPNVLNIIRQIGNERELIARPGTPGPGMVAGEVFSSVAFQSELRAPLVTGNDYVVFEGAIRRGATEDRGIWSYRSSADYVNVMRCGTPLSLFGNGVRFLGLVDFVANSSGDVVFKVNLTGTGVNINNDFAFVGWNRDSGLRSIMREGQSILLPDGTSSTVTDLSFSSFSGAQDGFATSLNDNRQFVYRVELADTRTAIMTTRVPTPSGAVAFLCAALAFSRRRRASTR